MNPTTEVALVTGGAKRIGAAIVMRLHQEGMNIVLHYHRSKQAAEELAARLNTVRTGSVVIVSANLANISSLAILIEQAVNAFGRLDVLVNNASRFYKTKIGEVLESSWEDLLGSNLKGPFFLSQLAAPLLKQTHGCIINIADHHADQPLRDYSVYCIAKCGLVMLTRSLAKELAPAVRVNAISPGNVAWPEGENALEEGIKQKIIDSIALKRHGHPGDIAEAVLFLIKEADYITGQVLTVDGGRKL